MLVQLLDSNIKKITRRVVIGWELFPINWLRWRRRKRAMAISFGLAMQKKADQKSYLQLQNLPNTQGIYVCIYNHMEHISFRYISASNIEL